MVLAPSVTSDTLAFRIRPAPFYGMRFRLRHLQFFLPLFLLAGCETPTEEGPPTLVFDAQIIFGFGSVPTVVQAETGGIVVAGELRTPTLGYSLWAALTSEGGHALRLEVEAYLSDPPIRFVAQNYYRAHVKNLARGSYDLTVVHTFLYTQIVTDTVFRGTIRVQ